MLANHMKNFSFRIDPSSRPNDQKGAALITVVLLLTLLLSVAAAIIVVTVQSNMTTVDLVAEEQALDAAEAGMQLALNVLRGNDPGTTVSFKDAAVRATSNKADDWSPQARLSNWLNYTYPASQPDRVPLSFPYDPYSGIAYSVSISAPDAVPNVIPTPNPNFIDGPVVKPASGIKPNKPAWHPWGCAHCSWDYTHCSLYNPPNFGTMRSDGYGCRHKHCKPPAGFGMADDGYQRLIVRVVGYGPRGARKQIELLVNRVMFDYDGESLIYLQGSKFGGDIHFSVAGTPKAVFDGGDRLVAIGLTNSTDQTVVNAAITQAEKVTITGKGDDYEVFNADDVPKWLSSADETRRFLRDLEMDSKLRDRWFTSYPNGAAGTDSNPLLTFVRGDATITSDGAGILVVTGELKIQTDRKFKGLILLLEGGMLRATAGKGVIEGSVVMARFGTSGDFQGPILNFSGGETTFKHNAARVLAAMEQVNMAVQGVREH
jgi:hypothetical protein